MAIRALILGAFVYMLPFQTKSQNLNSSQQSAVYNTIVLIGKAWTQNNLDTLEKYLDRDYVHTDVKGQILNRSLWLKYVDDRKKQGVTNPTIEFDDVQIKVDGSFAFVTGINTFSGQAYTSNENKTNQPQKIRFTQALKFENGIWKRFLFQATYIDTP